jgi:hypothetical protein
MSDDPREGFIKVIRRFLSAPSWAYGSYARTIGEQLLGDLTKAGLAVCPADQVMRLLRDWINAEVNAIVETSTNSRLDFAELAREARQRTEEMGVEWSDDLIPDYVRRQLDRPAFHPPIS